MDYKDVRPRQTVKVSICGLGYQGKVLGRRDGVVRCKIEDPDDDWMNGLYTAVASQLTLIKHAERKKAPKNKKDREKTEHNIDWGVKSRPLSKEEQLEVGKQVVHEICGVGKIVDNAREDGKVEVEFRDRAGHHHEYEPGELEIVEEMLTAKA